MVKNGIILVMMFLFIPGTVSAANLYLKDGGVIECIRAEQQGRIVYVLVNKYTEIELLKSEVAIKKTFRGKKTIATNQRHQK